MKNGSNQPTPETAQDDQMRSEYDFSKAVKNPYAKDIQGGRLIVLAPDVAASFPDTRSVNQALRACLDIRDAVSAPSKKKAG